jgi:hypothetical protein
MDKPLPRGVYQKHGAFYRVHRNEWLWLGRSYEEAARFDFWPSAGWTHRTDLLKQLRQLRVRCRLNAKGRRAIDFDLTEPDVMALAESANWRCAVTGLRFSNEVIANRRPYAPSIDRIDSALGYTKDNCRLVCAAVNIALNVWGETVFATLAAGYKRQRSKSIRQLSKAHALKA